VRILGLSLIFILIISCSSGIKSFDRYPSSSASGLRCSEGIQLFFEEGTRRELGHFSEEALFDLGVLRPGDIQAIKDDVVYNKLILAEDENLREETVKVISLIKKHRPDLPPNKVSDFYHELFHSCKL
jgi:hypothetical protein